MSLGLLDRPDTRRTPDLDGGKATHIVKQQPGKSAAALVTEARVFGTELEALCGYRWVPQSDPKDYPLCQGCKNVYDGHVDPSDGLPDPA